jgi:phage shock protein A
MNQEELKAKVDQHDRELSNQLTQVVELERKVAALSRIVKELFVLVSSTQRFSEQQEDAFKMLRREIPDLFPQL